MMGKSLVVFGPIQRLVTHKDYAVEMINSIIKGANLDACGEHTLKDLGAFSFYDLLRVCIRQFFVLHIFSFYSNHHPYISGNDAYEGPLG